MKDRDFSTDNLWMLPQAVDEILPPEAWRLETLRRRLLDAYRSRGYELVVPPLIEYLDSLLLGHGSDLDLQTFKLTDQLSGRTMGVRADTTSQAARIDAHRLPGAGPSRLCYVGSVLRTRTEGPGQVRNPIQVGAELYGHSGPESDAEIIDLMLETLRLCAVGPVWLDLGHVGIFRALAAEAGLEPSVETRLFKALQRKARAEINDLVEPSLRLPERRPAARRLAALVGLSGDRSVLATAAECLAGAGDAVLSALAHLEAVAGLVGQRHPDLPLRFDLGELAGYTFHTGVVFAAFVPGRGRELARGGRYDGIGAPFGRARPATGFSADLKQLLVQGGEPDDSASTGGGAILAPWRGDPRLAERVEALRAQGLRVIRDLPGAGPPPGCDRVLKVDPASGDWRIEPMGEAD